VGVVRRDDSGLRMIQAALGDIRTNSEPCESSVYRTPKVTLFYVGGSGPLFGDPQTVNKNEMNAWFAELDETALLLALIPGAIPTEAAHWLHVDDPDVAKVVNFGVSRSSSLDLHPPAFHDPPEISAESTNGLLPAYRKLDDKADKPRFKLAVDRLVRSRCQQIPGNRAIDLAIAFEVLFMGRDQDAGPKPPLPRERLSPSTLTRPS
jgi:hypothetical protein